MRKIFYNAKVYIEKDIFEQAILVNDGLIDKIGSNDYILALGDSDTELVNLGGRTVVPGFNDSHLHLLGVGEKLVTLSFFGVRSVKEIIRLGREFIEQNSIPKGAFIYGNSWNQDLFEDGKFELTKNELDQISTEHIIICPRVCGHIISVNSAALSLISPTSHEYEGGSIDIDDNGNFTGIFRENAMQLVDAVKPKVTVDEIADMIKTSMQYANQFGITSVQTNDAYFNNYEDVLAGYKKVLDSGDSTLRVYHQCYFANHADLVSFINKGYFAQEGNSMEKIGALKLFVDGSLGARTALLRHDYADAPGERGIACLTQDQLDTIVKTANDNNIQVAIHAIGDGAIEMVLDSFEKVISNGNNPLRHGIIHCQITDKGLLERFKQMDILAYVQPIFLNCDIHNAEQRVGKELASTSYAFNTMDNLGLLVSYGTDAPVENFFTMDNIHCAVNRQDLNMYPPNGWNMQEAVEVYKAIDNYTIGSAYSSFEENQKGRIKPGQFADIAVLEQDIFSVPKEEIKNIKVYMTVLGGKIVYKNI